MPKKLSAAILACIIIASSGPIGFARQDRGAVRISGNILPSLKLTVAGNQFHGVDATEGLHATIEAQGRTFADIRLKREGAISASRITIPLEIRTNVDYRLRLSIVTPDGCASGVRAYMDRARAGGTRVAADAVTNSRPMEIPNLAQAAPQTAIFSGTRVSMGGNFVTPANALLVNLNLAFPEGQSACAGHPVIRISLEPSI